jgi:hypothetical protein
LRSPGLLSILLLLLLAGVVLPAGAGAAWTAPVDLSANGRPAEDSQVAVDIDGDAVLTWSRLDGSGFSLVQARARSAAGALTSVQTLSAGGQNAFNPHVAVDDGGNAVFVWRRFDGINWRIQARARSAAGGLSAVQNLTPAGVNGEEPRVAVDADGDAVFAWLQPMSGRRAVVTRSRSTAGVLTPIQTVSDVGQLALDPQVGVDAGGNAVFTWRWSNGINFLVQTRARSAGGVLSAVQILSSTGQNGFEPQVAVDVDGDAVFTWRRSDGTTFRAQARRRSAAGALSAVQTLSAGGQDAFSPKLGVDDVGNAVFAWERFDGIAVRIQARARPWTTGTLSAVQDLSSAGEDAFGPQIAVDATGDAVVTWEGFDGTNSRIRARTRSSAGALGVIDTLSAAGQNAEAAQIGVDSTGNAVASWQRFDGANFRIQAAAGP